MEQGSSEIVLDPKRLADLRALAGPDMPDLPQEVSGMFIDTVRTSLAELREGTASGDASVVREAAHRIKGSSGNVGARQLLSLCDAIEEEARTGHIRPSATEEVYTVFAQVVEALRQEFDLTIPEA